MIAVMDYRIAALADCDRLPADVGDISGCGGTYDSTVRAP